MSNNRCRSRPSARSSGVPPQRPCGPTTPRSNSTWPNCGFRSIVPNGSLEELRGRYPTAKPEKLNELTKLVSLYLVGQQLRQAGNMAGWEQMGQ